LVRAAAESQVNHGAAAAHTQLRPAGPRAYGELCKGLRDALEGAYNPFTAEALVEFILDQPAAFKAGEGWAYTDTGYLLVGLILEKAAGRRFYDEVAQRFAVPLRVAATTPSETPILPLLAAGYTAADNPFGLPVKTTVAPGIMAWNPAIEWTGGGFVSSARDLAVWAKALYEGRAMKGNYVDELLRSVSVGGAGSGIRYGRGVGIYESGPFGPTYGHGGEIPGYVSSMRYYPQSKVTIAFQINTDVGMSDRSKPVLPNVEQGLAQVVMDSLKK
jgi:D-alanyl-D-alanine carboxypeptidase